MHPLDALAGILALKGNLALRILVTNHKTPRPTSGRAGRFASWRGGIKGPATGTIRSAGSAAGAAGANPVCGSGSEKRRSPGSGFFSSTAKKVLTLLSSCAEATGTPNTYTPWSRTSGASVSGLALRVGYRRSNGMGRNGGKVPPRHTRAQNADAPPSAA